MRWTQKQRDKACILIFAKSGMPKSSVELSNVAMDVCIDLACQRNELLEALKDITNLALGWEGTSEWRQQVTRRATAAIAKAEAQS